MDWCFFVRLVSRYPRIKQNRWLILMGGVPHGNSSSFVTPEAEHLRELAEEEAQAMKRHAGLRGFPPLGSGGLPLIFLRTKYGIHSMFLSKLDF